MNTVPNTLNAVFNSQTISPKAKWLAALAVYCLVVANVLWSFGSDAPIFTRQHWENGAETLTVSNVYHFWVIFINYVVIIYMIVNAFSGHPKTTTFWVCLAAMTVMSFYSLFAFCVLVSLSIPYAKNWISSKRANTSESSPSGKSDASFLSS